MSLITRTRRYEVRYRAAPAWEVGERTPEHRSGEHYPDDYAGKVLDVRPVNSELPSLRHMADKTRPVVEFDLDSETFAGLMSRTMKIVGTHSLAQPAPVTFDDRWGALASTLRVNFSDAEKAEAERDDPDAFEGRRFTELALIAKRALPAPDVHTGTGQYFTKETPAHNDDTQSGAPAGQVVTLTTGGLGTADAFIGGYVTNATRSETRAIVSHNDGDVTLEGSLANWLDTDDLDIYDAWSTVQGANDQLWTDQSTVAFAATQYIRVFAGTYDENVVPNASLNPQETTGKMLVIEGDPAVSRDTIIVAPSGGTRSLLVNCDAVLVRHMKFAGTPSIRIMEAGTGCDQLEFNDCIIAGSVTCITVSSARGLRLIDCHITLDAGGIVSAVLTAGLRCFVERCTFIGLGVPSYTGINSGKAGYVVIGCTFSGFTYPVIPASSQHTRGLFVNNTVYDCTYGLTGGGFNGHITAINNIFKDCTDIVLINAKPEEDSGVLGGRFTLRNNCYHGYTDFTDDGDTYAEFIAFNRVDASGDLDATDPLLTDPGAGDFSIPTNSPCYRTGHGSVAMTDINGVPFDANEPDIGAWSSGAWAPSIPGAPVITAAVDDGTGTSATLSMTADGESDVLSVRYKALDETAWTLFGSTRIGSGDLQVTGLTTTRYIFIATAERSTLISLPSDPWTIWIVSPGLTGPFEVIRSTLDQALSVYESTNVAWANAEYNPVRGTGYLRPTLMPGEPEQAALGDSGENFYTGIYQISVFEPTGEGTGPAESVAAALVEVFKRGSTFESGSVTIRVQKVWRSVAVQEKDWYHIPVSVMWFAYIAN